MQNNSLQSSASSQKRISTGCANKFEIELKLYLKLNWIFQCSKKCWSWPRMASRLLRSTSLSCSLPARTCWVTQYAVLAVNVDDRKCQRFLEERPLVRYFSLRTHPEKTKNNWPLSTIDIEREKICQWSFFFFFFQRLYKHSSGTLNLNYFLLKKLQIFLKCSIRIFALK